MIAELQAQWLTYSGTSSFKKNISRMSRGKDFAQAHIRIRELTSTRSLKRELVRAQEEIKRIQSVPLVLGQFMEAIDQKYAHELLSVGFMLTSAALVSYSLQPAPTMSFAFFPPSIARSSSHPPPSPSTATPTHLSTSFHQKPTPPSPCSARTRSQMSHTQMLEDWTCRSRRSERLLSCH